MSEYVPNEICIKKDVTGSDETNDLHVSIEVVLPLDDFERINQASFDTEYTSLQTLADSDPRRAYKITVLSLQHLLRNNQGRVFFGDVVVADKDTTTINERLTIAKNLVTSMFPDEDVTPLDLHIAVAATGFDTRPFDFNTTDTFPVVDMRVEPPQLAF